MAWSIDVVVRDALTQGDLERLAAAAEEAEDGLRGQLHTIVPMAEGLPTASFHVDRRDGRRRILAARLPLSPACTYRSGQDTLVGTAGMGSDDPGPVRVHMPTTVTIRGTVPPESTLAALAGHPARSAVDHPALSDARLTVVSAGLEGREGARDGFHLILPDVLVDIG